MARASKTRASRSPYVSKTQLSIEGFETPFELNLDSNNRWVLLAKQLPWDKLVGLYLKSLNNVWTGASAINPRVALGAVIIKHMCDLTDRETVLHIQENIYMQYFIGYSSFSNNPPFDPSLFVDIRGRLNFDVVATMNEMILGLETQEKNDGDVDHENNTEDDNTAIEQEAPPTHAGTLITDATAVPQDISYPTDLNLLNDAREKSEEIIDILHDILEGEKKPRSYRDKARKQYLSVAKKKVKNKKEIRKAIGKQLNYLKRNIKSIHEQLDKIGHIPLDRKMHKYLMVIHTLYEQQKQMHQTKTHSLEHRIVSIHQPHVRPIVRGKASAAVEFGAKINVSINNGYTFIDHLSWEAFNESKHLIESVEKFKTRFGCYPKEVLADKIYCTRENRSTLKELNIHLKAKPLGRPKAVEIEYVSPGERNPIEGKFGQAKRTYGLNRVKAKLQHTSESWIASIILVLNLVKLAGQVPYWIILTVARTLSAQLHCKENTDSSSLRFFFARQIGYELYLT